MDADAAQSPQGLDLPYEVVEMRGNQANIKSGGDDRNEDVDDEVVYFHLSSAIRYATSRQ